MKVQSGPSRDASVFRYVNPKRLRTWREASPNGSFRRALYTEAHARRTRPIAINTTIDVFAGHVTANSKRHMNAVHTLVTAAAAAAASSDDADSTPLPQPPHYLYFSDGISVLPSPLFDALQPLDFFDFGAARNTARRAGEAARAKAQAEVAAADARRAQKQAAEGKPKSAKRQKKDAQKIEDAVSDAVADTNTCDFLLWLGQKSVTAYPHYDCDDNFFTQVSGYKRFVLAPPTEHKVLGLYPSFHPLYRQALFDRMDITLPNATADAASAASAAAQQPIELYEAVLGPSDVLYLPPFWFHVRLCWGRGRGWGWVVVDRV